VVQLSHPGESKLYVFWISLSAAALSALSVASDAYNGHVRWTSIFTGMMILLAGIQLAATRARLARDTPSLVRAWMRPVAYLLHGAGFLFIILGVNALNF
jgi:hypothetical protein